MKRPLSSLILLLALLLPLPSAGGEPADLARETQLLEAEFELAKKPKVYFLFHLGEKKIYFKAWGSSVRELTIDRFALWHPEVEIKALAVLKRSALFQPKREEIRPKGAEEKEEKIDLFKADTFKVDALELEDMPARYTLTLDGGIFITVRPRPEGFFSALGDAWHRLVWRLTRPPLTLWNALLGRRPVYIDLALEKREAKALYWSAYEGAECIVYLP